MAFNAILWDTDDDPMEMSAIARRTASHQKKWKLPSGRPVIFGLTARGRHLMVVYEEVDSETVYPITAFEVQRRKEQ